MRRCFQPRRARARGCAAVRLAAAAHAGLFDDDEARRAILDLRKRVEQRSAQARAAPNDENRADLRRSLLDLQNQIEQLRDDIATLRGQNEQLTRDVAELQRKQQTRRASTTAARRSSRRR